VRSQKSPTLSHDRSSVGLLYGSPRGHGDLSLEARSTAFNTRCISLACCAYTASRRESGLLSIYISDAFVPALMASYIVESREIVRDFAET